MIGLSMSFCVKDILEGKVDLDEVEKIITGTKIKNEQDLEEVVKQYSEVYWRSNPPKAMEILAVLWGSGRIDQPRTRGEEPPWHEMNVWRESWDGKDGPIVDVVHR